MPPRRNHQVKKALAFSRSLRSPYPFFCLLSRLHLLCLFWFCPTLAVFFGFDAHSMSRLTKKDCAAFVLGILPDLLLCTKESSLKVRTTATYPSVFSLVPLALGSHGGLPHSGGHWRAVCYSPSGDFGREKRYHNRSYLHVFGAFSRAFGLTLCCSYLALGLPLQDFFTMTVAGLAGTTPHMMSATVISLSRILYQFHTQVRFLSKLICFFSFDVKMVVCMYIEEDWRHSYSSLFFFFMSHVVFCV